MVAAALPFAGQTEMRPVCVVAVIGGGEQYMLRVKVELRLGVRRVFVHVFFPTWVERKTCIDM